MGHSGGISKDQKANRSSDSKASAHEVSDAGN
jgi:hypothetical protein